MGCCYKPQNAKGLTDQREKSDWLTDVPNWKQKMFSPRRTERVLFINKAKAGDMNYYSCGQFLLACIWNIFTAVSGTIFQVLTRPTTCWHWPDRKRSAVSEEAPRYWDKRSWWSQLLLVGPGATEGRAKLLNNPTSLSNSLALWSNVRILARNPGTLPTIDIRHSRVNILSLYPGGGGMEINVDGNLDHVDHVDPV